MKKSDFKAQAGKLSAAVSAHVAASGAEFCESIYTAALPLLHWIDYLKSSESTGVCDEMLDGLRSVIVETAGCLALGLVRPAIFSLRGQIDLALSWLYFKDHPIEWRHVTETGDGYKLKKEVLEFFADYLVRFRPRFSALLSSRARSEDEPYRLLSAHIHSQSAVVIPSHGHLNTLVASHRKCQDLVALQVEVAEYISDVLLSYFADKWASLPPKIIESARARLSPEKQAKFFS